MVNHSCMPNATVTFSGRKAFLRALRHIKPDEEVEVSYIGVPSNLTDMIAAFAPFPPYFWHNILVHY